MHSDLFCHYSQTNSPLLFFNNPRQFKDKDYSKPLPINDCPWHRSPILLVILDGLWNCGALVLCSDPPITIGGTYEDPSANLFGAFASGFSRTGTLVYFQREIPSNWRPSIDVSTTWQSVSQRSSSASQPCLSKLPNSDGNYNNGKPPRIRRQLQQAPYFPTPQPMRMLRFPRSPRFTELFLYGVSR